MQPSAFDGFAPYCPLCRARGADAPLAVAHWADDGRGGQGVLACAVLECQARFPIIDGLPVLVANLAHYLNDAGVYLLTRDDLWGPVADLFGQVLPPGSWFDATRQHLSGYVRDHWGAYDTADLGAPVPGQARALALAGLALLDAVGAVVQGPVVELGAAAGGVTRALAERFAAPVLGLDLSAPLARFAVQALRGGTRRYPLRLAGTAYEERELVIPPPERDNARFWIADALAPPLAAGTAGLVVALNILDCVGDPAMLVRAAAHLVRPGGHLLLCTPFDWSTTATPADAWIGARSGTDPAPDLAAWAESITGFTLVARDEDHGWDVRVHQRAIMHYSADLVVLRRGI